MSRHLLTTLLCIGFITPVYAETCPSVVKIKADKISGWKAYDSEDGKPLSNYRLSQFKNSVKQFVLAEWVNKDNKNGTMHCYYQDKDGYSFEAYLSKDHFTPENSKKMWYAVSGSLQCAADMNKCQFYQLPPDPKQLAKR